MLKTERRILRDKEGAKAGEKTAEECIYSVVEIQIGFANVMDNEQLCEVRWELDKT